MRGGKPMIAGAEVPPKKRSEYLIIVRLRIISVEVPVGTASGSEEIWSYLDEESIAANRSAILGRNGFRIGLGREGALADIAKILKRMTGKKLGETMMMSLPGSPMPLILKQAVGARTVFTSYPDWTLSGADYPPGENVLTMVCTLDEDDPSTVLITGVPQMRSSYHKPEIRWKLGKASVAVRPVVYTFRPLMFRVRVPRGDFVVVGPGIESRRANSPGYEFLVRTKQDMEFETVLVLIPEVFASPVRAGPVIRTDGIKGRCAGN